MYRVKRLSGGSAESTRRSNDIATVLVTGGVGDIEVWGGSRGSTETWQQEQVEFVPVGAAPLLPIKSTITHSR